VDSTAELNQILPTQHVTANARRVRSPYSEQSTSSSEPDTPEPTTSKPKLLDALSHLTFSPKRPRSPALPTRSASPAHPHGPTRSGSFTTNRPETQHPPRSHLTARPSSIRVTQVDVGDGESTPRPRKVHLRTHDVNPGNALHPPTPSTGHSNFTRLAKGLAREIEARWDITLAGT
jgi:hypothetical protein